MSLYLIGAKIVPMYLLDIAIGLPDELLENEEIPLEVAMYLNLLSSFDTSTDEVFQFATSGDFPAVGEAAKLYIAADTGLLYRWDGAAYGIVGSAPITASNGVNRFGDDIRLGGALIADTQVDTADKRLYFGTGDSTNFVNPRNGLLIDTTPAAIDGMSADRIVAFDDMFKYSRFRLSDGLASMFAGVHDDVGSMQQYFAFEMLSDTFNDNRNFWSYGEANGHYTERYIEKIAGGWRWVTNYADEANSNYPNTRDNSGATAPINFLYTDALGNFLSAPVSAIVSPITASNGLTRLVNDIKLGGTITADTVVDTDNKNVVFGHGNFYDFNLVYSEGSGIQVSTVAYQNAWMGAVKRTDTNTRIIASVTANEYVAGIGVQTLPDNANNNNSDYAFFECYPGQSYQFWAYARWQGNSAQRYMDFSAGKWTWKTDGADEQNTNYPKTRDDTATKSVENLLYTGNAGELYSAPIKETVQDQLDVDQALGFMRLGADGKIATSFLPASVLGQMEFQTFWDANAGTPPTVAPEKGWYYVVNVAGAYNLDGIVDWKVGDWAVYDGSAWGKIDNTDAVIAVAGLIGNITSAALRIALSLDNVDNVSAANLRDRATHTGTQVAATISDFNAAADARVAAATIAQDKIAQNGATSGQALVWNGTQFAPANVLSGPGGSTTQVQYNNAGVLAGLAGVTYASNTMLHTSQATGAIPLAVRAMTGQTGNLQEWRNSVGTVVWSVRSDGAIIASGGPTATFSTVASAALSLGGVSVFDGLNTPVTGMTFHGRDGSTSAGADLYWRAGNPSSGAGGKFSLTGGTPVAANQNGGAVELNGGPPTGSGVRGQIRMPTLPTSASGLAAGDLWNNGGVVTVA